MQTLIRLIAWPTGAFDSVAVTDGKILPMTATDVSNMEIFDKKLALMQIYAADVSQFFIMTPVKSGHALKAGTTFARKTKIRCAHRSPTWLHKITMLA